jgi:hypothetical protein
VLSTAEFFTRSDLDVVWWQVLSQSGDDITIDEVRAWLWPADSGGEPADCGQFINDWQVWLGCWDAGRRVGRVRQVCPFVEGFG